jgi:TP901 family phage tail tape measure protein
MADVNSTFSYNANFGPAQAQIRALTADISSLNAAFLSLDKNANARKSSLAQGFMKDLGALGGFKTQVVDLTSDVERFGKALQKNQLTLRQYYKEAAQAYKKNSMARRLAEDEVRRAQSQLVGMGSDMQGRKKGMLITPLSIDTSDINTKMAIAQKQFGIFNKLVSDGATQLINWGKNTQWAGRQLTVGLTVPLTIFGATVSKTFREVDKELTRFAKVYGSDLVGANKSATDSMRAQVEQLSKDFAGKYGIAARETAGLAADLAATGLEGQKLLDSVAQTTRLAVLGEVDRQEAMKATLALQNAFNMSTGELAESINFLNAVENQTSASLQDLTEAIPRVGPVINSLGGDVKDLAVLLVAMKEGGVNAAEGANAIKSGLASLINPTRQASETAKQYGIDLEGIVKANKGQLMPTIMAFQGALKNLDDFAKAQIIEQLFGKYQFARISALFDNLNASGSQTVEVMKLMGASSQELATIANGEIRTLTESSSMRFQRSMEAIKASLLPVGETLTNAVIPFLEKTANVINMIVEYGRSLPEPVKNFLKLATGLTLIAGPIIMLAGVFGNFLGYLTKGAMMFTRLGAAMAGLRTEKFELLDDNQLAAARSSDILAASYNTQTSSLARLNASLNTYIRNLRETQRVQPNIFAAGAPSAGRGKAPKKMQSGGSAWVPGSGSGDRIPAMLEPGEYVVNRNAAQKNKGLLNHINFKSAPRFMTGGEVQDFKNNNNDYKDIEKDILKNSKGARSQAALINWMDSVLSKEKMTKGQSEKFVQEMKKAMSLVPAPYTMEKIVGASGNRQQWIKDLGISGRVRSEQARGGAPTQILSMKSDQSSQLSKMSDTIFKKLVKAGFSNEDAKRYASIEIAHINKNRKKIDGNLLKVWKPSNLSFMPLIENQAFENLTRGGLNSKVFEEALLKASGGDKKAVSSIMRGTHPVAHNRKMFLKAISLLDPSMLTGATGNMVRGLQVLHGGSRSAYTPTAGIVSKNDPRYREEFYSQPTGSPKTARSSATGAPLTMKQRLAHVGGRLASKNGFIYQMTSREGIVNFAEDGLDNELEEKQQKRSVRGQKAGAVGGLAMTAAFMLPALTGTNESLSKFTNTIMTAMMAVSAFSTVMQVRGIGGSGPGRMSQLGQSLGGRSARLQQQGGLERTFAGGSKRLAAQGVAKQGAGLLGRGAAAMMGGGAALMIPLAVIAAGVAAFVLYQKSIDNARKAGESLYAEQTKAAEYYGIELQNVNSAMAENVKIAKEMGLAQAPTAATIDPALKTAILEQEENKKLVEEIKKSNDPASIFLGQYGKMLQQGFSPDQAKEVLSVLAQASGKMGALQGISPTLNATVVKGPDGEIDANATAIKATEAVGQAAIGNINNLFSETKTQTRTIATARGDFEVSGNQPLTRADYAVMGANAQNARTVTESVTSDRRLTSQQDFANLEGQITQAFKSALMSPDLGVGFETMSATIEATFKKGAETGTNKADIASAMSDSAKAMATEMGFEDDSKFVTTLNAALDDTKDKVQGTKDQFLLVQAAAAGIDLTTIIADGKLAADEAERLRTEMAAIDTQKQINLTINTQISDAMDAIDDQIQAQTAFYDQQIASNEAAQEAENERTKNFQKNMEKKNKAIQKEIKGIQRSAKETIDAKEKEIEAIEKSSSAYIKSLQSNKEEESFQAQQSKTALGGLGALASGDVIGYLAAQEDMASDASQYAQQGEIEKIQEIADAEVERIQEAIDKVQEKTDKEVQSLQDQLDKNQELMDGEGERHEKRMANLQKEALKIQTDKAAELGRLNDTKAKLQELMDMPVGEKLGKDLGAYADAISEVASNMPKSAQDTMTKLATSFGDNFQSVFDAELERSAEEYGVNPTQLKDLIKKSLPGKGGGGPGAKASDRFAKGGLVTGPGTGTSDSIPAQLSNGEYVVKADSVKRIGKATLDKINAGTGGMSGRTSTTEGYRVGGAEAPAAAAAFAGGIKTAISAVNAANALASAAASAMDEEPENSDGGGSGVSASIPEKLGKVARILRGNYRVSARGTYASGNKHSSRYATAIDYATPTGTPVYAMAGGSALNRNKGNSSFGKYVTIKHNDGTESLYAHLNSHGKGGSVSAGDFIGDTGNTGNSTGPHLHFEWSALKNGQNPPGMRIGGETMSDGLAKLHKGEMVLTKPLTQTLKEGISDMRVGVPAMSSTSGVASSGTMVSDNRVINVNVNATGSGMNPDMIAQRIVGAINKEEGRRSFRRST